jgi:glycosidase
MGDMSPVESSARQVYAFLRYDQTETLLVLVNLDDEAVDAYTLSMEQGPLSADASAALLLGTGEVASPAVTAESGLADYTPIAPLPPHSSFIIRLGAG